MVPFAFFSLVHGPLSDALGRRRVDASAAWCSTRIGSLGCSLAPNFGTLLACRVLQGMAAGVGHVVGRAVVRDLLRRRAGAAPDEQHHDDLRRWRRRVAPIIGGWVHVWFGWRAVFGTMALLAAALLVFAHVRLPGDPSARSSACRCTPARWRGSCLRIARASAVPAARLAELRCASSRCTSTSARRRPSSSITGTSSETQFAALTLPIIGGYVIAGYASGRHGRAHGAGAPGAARLPRAAGDDDGDAAAAVLRRRLRRSTCSSCCWRALRPASQLVFPIVTLRIFDLFPSARGAPRRCSPSPA